MRNILLIISILIGLNSFAQDDFFWSYSHPNNTYDTLKVTTQPFQTIYLGGTYYTYSGDSLLVKTPRGTVKIPSNVLATQISQYIYNQEVGYIIAKHNDLYWISDARDAIITDLSQFKKLKIFGNEVYSSYRIKYDAFVLSKALEEIYLQETLFSYVSNYDFDLSNNNLLRKIRIVNSIMNSLILPTSPDLSDIYVSPNQTLSYITFGDLNPNIWRFYAYNCSFDQTNIDKILKYFVDSNRKPFELGTNGNDNINLCGINNGYPSSTGYGYVSILTNRGWYVCVNNSSTTPIVSTDDPTMVGSTSATLGGNASSDGGAAIASRGVAYGTSLYPTIAGSHTTLGNGVGLFSSSVTGLTSSTIYHARAYATNSNGTSYGEDKVFTTTNAIQTVPELITTAPTAITTTTAQSGGTITFDGNYEIVAKGVCWSTSSNPTIAGSHTTDGSGTDSFTSSITGLSANTKYYLRAYATNRRDAGGSYVYATGYGQEEIFTTASNASCNLPNVSTNAINMITTSSANGGGNVTNDGGCDVAMKGLCWSAYNNPTTSDYHVNLGSGTGAFSGSITGLTCGITYYVRAYATNSSGTAYGNQVSFTTQPNQLAIGTQLIFNNYPINPVQVTSGFTNYGCDMIERGVVWSTSPNPTISDNKHILASSAEGYISESFSVTPGTYYFSGYAINNIGVSYYQYDYALTIPSPTFDPCTLSIGDSYGGGIVAYIYQYGDPGYVSGECHGIIAATSDQGTAAYFGCYGSNLSGASSILLKGGQQNTIDIITGCSDSGTSARLCYDYSSGSYSDWWLPSLNELLKLYANRSLIGGFDTSAAYSSSSEVDAYSVYSVNFVDGSYSVGSNTKLYPFHVRAIRYF